MISIDTNLVVRFLTNDDKAQAKYAAKLIEDNAIFLAKSVLLETERVLRYTYELDQSVVRKAFESLLGLPRVTVEDPACIIKTLQWYSHDFDFADAMHLASSQTAEQFATLDKAFIKQAKKINVHLLTM